MWLFIRLFIGIVLFASGIEKVFSHYQNFLYVVQAYQMLPSWAEHLTARILPWVELLTGLFLILGLWIRQVLLVALLQFGLFIIVVGQALLRKLPLDQCGCFGNLIHVNPSQIIVFDSIIVICIIMSLRHLSKFSMFSLDRYFERS